MKKNKDLLALRNKYIPQAVYNTIPSFIENAKGAKMTDVEGFEMIDFAGGIATINVGHCHPKVVNAIKDQAEKYIHTCFHVAMYEPYIELAQKLCEITPGDFPKMAFFANSGAEAVENAIKVARYYTKRSGIITFENAFHGRTLMGMSLTSKVKPYKLGFGPFAPEIYRIPYGDANLFETFLLDHVAPESVAAIIAEPVQGEGGFITPPPDFFPKIVEICKENGILFIADEIQSGMGRTGKMFAIEHWNVVPDIILLAKSLAAGLPLSAIIGRKEIMDSPHIGGLGGTYSGNPVACRAALAVLDIFQEENVLDKAVILGQKLNKQLKIWQESFEIVGNIHGIGSMLAFEIIDHETKKPDKDKAKDLVNLCHKSGLVILTCGKYGNKIRLLMPLVINDEDLEKGLNIIEENLQILEKKN
ncbi:MAG: 4-aminobutyrate--2-oxoglutarate transaminase [Candidatus Lokiarchaeota archaeon]|nr:4-aminobutyrate--2-oxoglutarate transaminase [Candidatus Lokiarchaeota archaeon]